MNAPAVSTVTRTGPAPARAITQLQRALTKAAARPGLLTVAGRPLEDAALPYNPPGALSVWSTWAEVAPTWQAAIHDDQLAEVMLPSPGLDALAIDPRDGAWIRGGPGGLAYLPAAVQQAVALMLQGVPKERNVANVMHFECRPPARSLLWEDLREKSKRRKPARFRLYRHRETGLRTVRAVLSERYPVGFFDDAQLIPLLAEVADPALPARFTRGVFESRAQVVLGGVAHRHLLQQGQGNLRLPFACLDGTHGARALLHVRNSETGDGRLGFWAGLRLDVLDEVVGVRRGGGIAAEDVATTERTVTVATAGGSTERNHTLPWARWTPEERKAEAERRIRESRDEAIRSTVLLAAAWTVALEDYRQGYAPEGGRDSMTVEVLLDLLEEGGHLGALDAGEREKLRALMQDDKRLPRLSVGSAAYMAGAFALLARDAKTQEEADRWQEAAGRWVEEGWRGEGTGVQHRRLVMAETTARLDALKKAAADAAEAAKKAAAKKAAAAK